jgi:nicotinate dehydrogenase subunit A
MAATIELHVNGRKSTIEAEPNHALLAILRDELNLTGSKYGCGEGRCGACTVLIDGQAAKACITLLSTCQGKQIQTIEGLAPEGELHPVQQAFLTCDAMQCGFCTPGMIMAACALLKAHPQPTTGDIVRAMDGNVCRCGTYARIEQAILTAASTAVGRTS